MILVFGGTTEGRKAVEVLEEAGTPYFYSTRSSLQQVRQFHGTHLTGAMDVAQIVACLRQRDIRLIVDAAHPFAETLHRNILAAAAETGMPVIRYERIYPSRTDDVVWCRDYDAAMLMMEEAGVRRLLALTGVNTIARLRPFWSRHDCWFRILNRDESLAAAREASFPEERLVFYAEDATSALIAQLHPDAILTKESGESGGFGEKVGEALRAGLRVFAVEHPAYPPFGSDSSLLHIETVNGPHGLRRMVERLLPDFYPLRSGLTTGTCATAAAVAATIRLTTGEMPPEVPVLLPDGETIRVGVSYGDTYAAVVKEAGDDPDVTDGLEIRATVEPSDTFSVEGGEGVGRFTLPGFDFPPGEAAINRSPRQMLRRNIAADVRVTISVPRGEEVARRTFNPRLGIEGGISIIGVSGIVKPFSEEAFIGSIRKCMQVARASGADRVVINSGAKSERFVRGIYPDLPPQAFVEYGNYIGETLRMAAEAGFRRVTLGVMLGKAVKLAGGHLDTHSRRAVMDKDFVRQMLSEAYGREEASRFVDDLTLARDLWKRIPAERRGAFADVVIRHCLEHCRPLLPDGELTILLIDDEGAVYSPTEE